LHLVKCNVPQRWCLVQQRKWQIDIDGMLRRIPMISKQVLKSYFTSIDIKLSVYENLKDAPVLLELALWKSKIMERFDKNKYALVGCTKMECRTDSLSMVGIIVPNILTFLTDGDDGNHGVDCDNNDNDDGDDNSDDNGDSLDSDKNVEDDNFWGDGDDDGDEDADMNVNDDI
jgi:hypothetical protein